MDKSLSNYFLLELEGMSELLVDSAADCDTGNIWDLAIRARENAINDFRTDYLAALLQYYQKDKQPYRGYIGEAKYTKDLKLTSALAGLQLSPYLMRGGELRIKKIGTFFNQSATLHLKLYNQYEIDPIKEVDLETEKDKLKWNELPEAIVLPLNYNKTQEVSYALLYEVASLNGMLPKDVKTDCNCGGGAGSVLKYPWKLYTKAGGINIDSLSKFHDQNTSLLLESNGLLLDVELSCKTENLICTEDYPLDFDNPLTAVMAKSIQYKGGELLIEYILASGNLNRFTILDKERLWGKRNHYRKSFDDRITYLAKETKPYLINDCFTCADFNSLLVSGIFS